MTQLTKKELIQRWLPQLVEKTGRTRGQLQGAGLFLGDFEPQGVRLSFEDGSRLEFKRAFHLVNWVQPELIAVFTEHCGYHEFSLGPQDSVAVGAAQELKTKEGWKQLAETFLKDATNPEISELSREDLAFDAGYLNALQVLGVSRSSRYEHPDAQALQDVAEALDWSVESMSDAEYFLEQRNSAQRDGSQAPALLAWARSMQAAALAQ